MYNRYSYVTMFLDCKNFNVTTNNKNLDLIALTIFPNQLTKIKNKMR